MIPDYNKISISEFTYPLTDERIAKFPLEKRDESKLLVYKNSRILEDRFTHLADYLDGYSLVVLNDTKVVRARLLFRKPTGSVIEVFCLEPVSPTTEIQLAFQQKGSCTWKCLVGNAKRWKVGVLESTVETNFGNVLLKVEMLSHEGDSFILKFAWQPEILTFAEVLEVAGKVPLPPYLHREANPSDALTYQTVYARYEGSVAAPTAGLHFTPGIFQTLKNRQISHDYVTLHVGAGTFKPVGDEGLEKHEMHTEQIVVNKQTIEKLIENQGKILAVGTTSVRTLESLFWYGVKLEKEPDAGFLIHQFDPYHAEFAGEISTEKALQNIIKMMNARGICQIHGFTQLMIVPGYKYRLISGMVTNFHQPQSTLLLLIAAWLGDSWKDIYNYALNHEFRFLSYGDACLFVR